MDYQEFDMLGDTVDPNKGKRGRRTHVVNDQNRELVIELVGLGYSQEDIAAALCISEPTLRRHYKKQLIGRQKAHMRMIGRTITELKRQIQNGKTSAVNAYIKLMDKRALVLAPQKPAASEEEKLGKKEAANQKAPHAHEGTSWADIMSRRHHLN